MLHSGLELLTTAVLMLDESLHVTYANPAAETLLAHGRKHLLGVGLDMVLRGNDGFLQTADLALLREKSQFVMSCQKGAQFAFKHGQTLAMVR